MTGIDKSSGYIQPKDRVMDPQTSLAALTYAAQDLVDKFLQASSAMSALAKNLGNVSGRAVQSGSVDVEQDGETVEIGYWRSEADNTTLVTCFDLANRLMLVKILDT